MIGVLEVNRVDLLQRHELANSNGVVLVRLELLQFLVGEGYVGALLDLVSTHELAAIDDSVVNRAINLLLDAAFVLGVKEVEADRLGPGRGVQLYRDGN